MSTLHRRACGLLFGSWVGLFVVGCDQGSSETIPTVDAKTDKIGKQAVGATDSDFLMTPAAKAAKARASKK